MSHAIIHFSQEHKHDDSHVYINIIISSNTCVAGRHSPYAFSGWQKQRWSVWQWASLDGNNFCSGLRQN